MKQQIRVQTCLVLIITNVVNICTDSVKNSAKKFVVDIII